MTTEKDINASPQKEITAVKPRKKRKKPTHYIVNSEMLEEVKKSKKRLAENPELGGQAITPKLANMFIRLVDHYATKQNWSGYSYLEEFKGEALVNLVNKWYKFDCDKYDKPFAYYSMLITRSFMSQVQKEKKPQKIRDAVITSRGETPSFAAQDEYEKKWAEQMKNKNIDDNDDVYSEPFGSETYENEE